MHHFRASQGIALWHFNKLSPIWRALDFASNYANDQWHSHLEAFVSVSGLAADLLAGTLAFALPMTGPLERKFYRSDPRTPLKLLVYVTTMVLLIALAAAAVRIDGWGRLIESPAPVTAWLWAPGVVAPVLAVAVAGFSALSLMPLIQSLRGVRWRRAYAAAYRRALGEVPGLIPNTATERAAWIGVSFAAGICEELLCRGFLIRFLRESWPGAPMFAALVISSLIFGLAHLYQGLKAVAGTSIIGLVFGLVFLLSGSLIGSIVLHVLVDLQVCIVLRPLPDNDPDPARRSP